MSHDPVPVLKEPRQELEYQAAMELEMWKQQQEELFETQVIRGGGVKYYSTSPIYSLFSDGVGVSLHNIDSLFLPVI